MSRLTCQWHALYTFPKQEKKIERELSYNSIDCYLPLIVQRRKWTDRIKKVELPLFPCYIFVRINKRQVSDVLGIQGAARLVKFDGEPAVISQSEIDRIKLLLNTDTEIDNEEAVITGATYRVNYGPFAGLEGTLIRKKGKCRLVVSVRMIGQAVSVEIPKAYLELVRK